MSLMNASHNPPVVATQQITIFEACTVMEREGVASIALVDSDGRLVGLFEERDLARKVVLNRIDPEKTSVGEVMTSPCRTISPDRTFADALNVMMEHDIRHLPIVDEEQHLLGVLSLRTLLRWKVEDLDNALRGVTAYFAADGIGGG